MEEELKKDRWRTWLFICDQKDNEYTDDDFEVNPDDLHEFLFCKKTVLNHLSWTKCESYSQWIALKEIEGESNFNTEDFYTYEKTGGKVGFWKNSDMKTLKNLKNSDEFNDSNFINYHVFIQSFKNLNHESI